MVSRMIKSLYDFFFFADERIGYRGKCFKMLKFRTMKKGVKADESDVICSAYHSDFDDPRVSNRFCRFLRRFYLDELANL